MGLPGPASRVGSGDCCDCPNGHFPAARRPTRGDQPVPHFVLTGHSQTSAYARQSIALIVTGWQDLRYQLFGCDARSGAICAPQDHQCSGARGGCTRLKCPNIQVTTDSGSTVVGTVLRTLQMVDLGRCSRGQQTRLEAYPSKHWNVARNLLVLCVSSIRVVDCRSETIELKSRCSAVTGRTGMFRNASPNCAGSIAAGCCSGTLLRPG